MQLLCSIGLGKPAFPNLDFILTPCLGMLTKTFQTLRAAMIFRLPLNKLEWIMGHIKIFARKDQQWWKISIASPTGQSLRSSYSVDWLLCTAEEGERFYETLNSGGLFSLPEEDELTERCGEIEQAFDALEYRIQLKAGMRVRTLKYTDPTLWRQNCSNIEAWTNVERIVEAFKTRWYEHGNQSIIKKFLNLVNNHESKFIDFAVLVTPAPSDSLSFNTMLSRFRTSLKIHQGESQVNLFPYTELKPRRDDLPIIEVEQGMLKDTYVVVDDRNRVLFPVIIKNQRIMSFMTSEGKDGKNYFVFWE